MSPIARLESYISTKGIKKKDFPKYIFFHELLGVAILACTWSLCHKFPPSNSPLLKEPLNKIKLLLPASVIEKYQKLPISPKMGSSYIEASCLRKIIRPITLPGRLWMTYELVKLSDKLEASNKIAF